MLRQVLTSIMMRLFLMCWVLLIIKSQKSPAWIASWVAVTHPSAHRAECGQLLQALNLAI